MFYAGFLGSYTSWNPIARPLRPAVGVHHPENYRSSPDKHRRPTVHPAHDPAFHRVDGDIVIWGEWVGIDFFSKPLIRPLRGHLLPQGEKEVLLHSQKNYRVGYKMKFRCIALII